MPWWPIVIALSTVDDVNTMYGNNDGLLETFAAGADPSSDSYAGLLTTGAVPDSYEYGESIKGQAQNIETPVDAGGLLDSYDPLTVVSSLSNAARLPAPPPPRPATNAAETIALYWTREGRIFTNVVEEGATPREGTELKIKGVSWFGLESKPCAIGGLDQMPVEAGAAFLREQGFNAVRIPLAVSALISGQRDGECMPTELSAKPTAAAGATSGYATHNPTYMGTTYMQMLTKFIQTLGDHGLLVLLDLHVTVAGQWPDDGKIGAAPWPNNFRRAWALLTAQFCDPFTFWNVMAADLKNEPHGM